MVEINTLKSEIEECAVCGGLDLVNNMIDTADGLIDSNCWIEVKSNYVECHDCHIRFNINDVRLIDGDWYCDNCSSNDVVCVCEYCGDYFFEDNGHRDGYHTVCSSCFDDNYCYCANCDEIIQYDDAYQGDDGDLYCERCYNENDDCRPSYMGNGEHIQSYSYVPELNFITLNSNSEPDYYLGVELEVEKGGYSEDNAYEILSDVNSLNNELLHICYDGSLNEGFEMVTQPMSLEYHLKSDFWTKIRKSCLELGYRSHNTEDCGMHVHMSRNGITDDMEADLTFFFEKFWNIIWKFSRRRGNYCSYCRKLPIEDVDVKRTKEGF